MSTSVSFPMGGVAQGSRRRFLRYEKRIKVHHDPTAVGALDIKGHPGLRRSFIDSLPKLLLTQQDRQMADNASYVVSFVPVKIANEKHLRPNLPNSGRGKPPSWSGASYGGDTRSRCVDLRGNGW